MLRIRPYHIAVAALLILGGVLTALVLQHGGIAVLEPRGVVAQAERDLMVVATLLSLMVVLPVFGLTFVIAWRYRASNSRARYQPDWDHHRGLEAVWWGIPCAIILVLAILTWTSSHQLDPYRPITGQQKPLTVEVVALPWKWLFIYPEERIATVNYLQLPAGRPVAFRITADAPMNSFWIPQLGGQVYAMAGMSTQLHLMPSRIGRYQGSSANLSGRGFAGMTFETNVTSATEFASWTSSAGRSSRQLTWIQYQQLAAPSENTPVTTYAVSEPQIYDKVIMKYMMPTQVQP